MTGQRRRMRSAGVTLGLTALVAASLSGCSNEDDQPADYAAVCVNPETQVRVDDEQCDDDREYSGVGGGFFWWYMATSVSRQVPAIGSRYSAGDGTYRVSSVRNAQGRPVSVQRGGLDTKGGDVRTISRGGFGKAGGGGGSKVGSGG